MTTPVPNDGNTSSGIASPANSVAEIAERPDHIPEGIWNPLALEARVMLCQMCEEMRRLQERVRELEARSKQNSSNSSLPPSQDRPWDKPVKRKKSRGGKRGAQNGHPPHWRQVIAPERVQHIVNHYPPACKHCDLELGADEVGAEDFQRHQVVELPEITADVTEHRLHAGVCPRCRRRTRAALPAGVPTGNFGPRLVAMIAVMTVAYQLSKRQVKALLDELLGIDIATGTIAHVHLLASKALADPVEAIQEALKQTEVAYQDETRWPESGKNGYAWVTVSGPYAYYEIARSRSGEVACRQLGGPEYKGSPVTDRYVAYNCYPMERRGICHSHLLRDYQKIADRSEDVRPIGEGLLNLEGNIFEAWHAFKDGNIDRPVLQERLVKIAVPYEKLLFQGMAVGDSKVAGMCANIHGHWEAIWNFGWVEGMEPTNNEAERSGRLLVTWRKKCFGTQSVSGSLFVAQMATIIETCRRQCRSAFKFLADALEAYLRGASPPSLLVTNSS